MIKMKKNITDLICYVKKILFYQQIIFAIILNDGF